MQQKETTNPDVLTDVFNVPPDGRIIAIDPGTKRCGIAVCDEMRITTRPLPLIARTSWKKLLLAVNQIVSDYDAKAVVVGLPLESDGSESVMSAEARRIAQNFALSLEIPVFLQDERSTSYEAKSRLWQQGRSVRESRQLADSEAASIILADFLDRATLRR